MAGTGVRFLAGVRVRVRVRRGGSLRVFLGQRRRGGGGVEFGEEGGDLALLIDQRRSAIALASTWCHCSVEKIRERESDFRVNQLCIATGREEGGGVLLREREREWRELHGDFRGNVPAREGKIWRETKGINIYLKITWARS